MSQFTTVTLTLLKGFGQTMNIFLLTLAFPSHWGFSCALAP